MVSNSRLLPFSLALPLALVGGARPSSSPGDVDAVVSEAVNEAISRVQLKLEDSIVLWEDHTRWENAWRVQTEHYEVVTSQSYAFGKETALELEARFADFQSVLDTSFEPTQRFQILVFPSLADYNVFGEEFGAEHSSFMGGFYASQNPDRAVGAYYTSNRPLCSMWLAHSAFHQFRAAAFPDANPPDWVEEGFACYFGSFGDYPYLRSELLRMRASEFENDWVPLRALLNTPMARYGDRFHNRMVELALLFTYLRIFREDTRTILDGETLIQAPFEDYLTLLISGGDASAHPVHALLNEDLDSLEADFREFAF